jgi:addiction module HigA family antidote
MTKKPPSPLHPGEELAHILERMGVSITFAATKLQVSRVTLSRFINGAITCSTEMALKLEAATEVSAETWLLSQMRFDLYHARQKQLTIQPFLTY